MSYSINTYCINLKSRKDRYEDMLSQFSAQKMDVIFIEAIREEDVKVVGIAFPSHAHQACLLSHKKTVEKAISDNVDYALILEDDVALSVDFMNRVKDIISKKPKFDVIHLGHYNECKSTIEQDFYRMNGDNGTFAYLVSKEFLPKLLELYKENNEQCDRKIAQVHKTSDIWGIYPHLAIAKEGFSNLIKQRINYYRV